MARLPRRPLMLRLVSLAFGSADGFTDLTEVQDPAADADFPADVAFRDPFALVFHGDQDLILEEGEAVTVWPDTPPLVNVSATLPLTCSWALELSVIPPGDTLPASARRCSRHRHRHRSPRE